MSFNVDPVPFEEISPRKITQYVNGKFTELLCVESRKPELNVLIIPGNPGVVSFYEDFVKYLWHFLDGKASITVICHLGHTLDKSKELQLFTLSDQIEHKINFLEQQKDSDNTTPWVLIGHSIGTHIALETFRAVNSVKIIRVIGLYPFLSLNEHSSWQKLLNFAAHQWLLNVILAGIGQLLSYIPLFLLSVPLKLTIGSNWTQKALQAFCEYMLKVKKKNRSFSS
jgi:pimeloyl-ACP methyl ester carboxylesterase